MSKDEMIQAAQHMLDNCKLSGTALELCETIVFEGPADIMSHDDAEADLAWRQRRNLKQLCALHGVAV